MGKRKEGVRGSWNLRLPRQQNIMCIGMREKEEGRKRREREKREGGRGSKEGRESS
jgi:hypothetical protein